jgi:hypothetical protein
MTVKRVVLPKPAKPKSTPRKPIMPDFEDWVFGLETFTRSTDCGLVRLYGGLLLKTLQGKHAECDEVF